MQETIKRKLTTILAADVAGYSRLMSDDEEATLRTLQGHREIIDGLIDKHHGRIFNTAGDSVLAEFGSTVEAVRCAISIQEELPVHNAELAEDRQMQFRIGVNVGDVMVEDDNLYGDGVNVAARLEGVAEPGGICISGSAFDQVKDRLSIGFEDIGPQEVKNIAQPIPAFRVVPGSVSVAATPAKPAGKKRWQLPAAAAIVVVLVAGGLAVWQPWIARVEAASVERMAFALPDEPSIAVLPFANLNGVAEQDYLGNGLAENITTALTLTPNMFVIAGSSTSRYKGKDVPVRQVAEELGVRYVLRGSVQTSGEQVRVTTQLIDALSGRILWADRYEREAKDTFILQDEITLNVLRELSIKLTSGESARLNQSSTKNLEAYQLVRGAIPVFLRLTKENNAEARRKFERAAELDPNYAVAWFFIGNTYFQAARFGWSENRASDMAKAKELAEKARTIDPTHPSPHQLFAQIALFEGRHEDAIALMEKSVSFAPNHSIYLAIWGRFLAYAGKPEEGLPLIQKSLRLSPFPQIVPVRFEGETYHALGRYDEALVALERARALVPKSPLPVAWLMMTYADMGQIDNARATAKELLTLRPNFNVKRYVSSIQYKDRTEVEKRLASLRKLGMPELKLD